MPTFDPTSVGASSGSARRASWALCAINGWTTTRAPVPRLPPPPKTTSTIWSRWAACSWCSLWAWLLHLWLACPSSSGMSIASQWRRRLLRGYSNRRSNLVIDAQFDFRYHPWQPWRQSFTSSSASGCTGSLCTPIARAGTRPRRATPPWSRCRVHPVPRRGKRHSRGRTRGADRLANIH